jgi:hypothetical protein
MLKRRDLKRSTIPEQVLNAVDKNAPRDIFGAIIQLPEPVDKRRKKIPFRRIGRERAATPSRMIAYDFETTRIEKGTPRPLYITAD